MAYRLVCTVCSDNFVFDEDESASRSSFCLYYQVFLCHPNYDRWINGGHQECCPVREGNSPMTRATSASLRKVNFQEDKTLDMVVSETRLAINITPATRTTRITTTTPPRTKPTTATYLGEDAEETACVKWKRRRLPLIQICHYHKISS